jgi:outer membrane protein assembly factor BamA
VDVTLRVHRGDTYLLGGLRLLETRTRPDAVRRLALWRIGEPFSQERLKLGVKRLSRTGYYESAELAGLFRDSTRNLIYPALRLPDLQGNRVSGLLGYDSRSGGGKLTGYVDLHLINLFGTARDLDFTFDSRTGDEREARLAYVEPWILKLPVGLRVELDFLQQDTLFWEWNRNLVFFQDLGFNSRMEVRLGDQQNSDAVAGLQTHAIRSGLRLLFDGRDRVPLPASGYRAEMGATGLRRELGDSLYYLIQLTGVAESWIPLTSRLGLKLGLHAATNLPLSHVNRGELYYVGGANSLRGYREREFPTNAYAFGQAELQTWLGRRGRLFAFADPGLVNRLVAKYSWREVLGYGAGIELSKGDWSLSLSYALSPERAVGDGLLHVGVDNRF